MTNEPKHPPAMTDEAKALVERLRQPNEHERWLFSAPFDAADLIETQAREIERLREALTTISHEGGQAEARFARAALAGDSHDQ